MHSVVFSRHRTSLRWPIQVGVPAEDLTNEVAGIGAFELSSSELSDSDDTMDYNDDMPVGSLSSDGPAISTRSDLAQEVSQPSSLLASLASPVQRFPQLLSESDLECPLCCRLLYQPVTTSCGTEKQGKLSFPRKIGRAHFAWHSADCTLNVSPFETFFLTGEYVYL